MTVQIPYYHGLLYQPDCGDCYLRYDTKVLPDGPIPARIAFVGEEPGAREKVEGRGFVGPSGQALWHLAKMAGFAREEVWVTNAALCAARDVKLTSGECSRMPKAEVKAIAAQCCRARLVAELKYVNPQVIVPLGNWALWALSDIAKAKIYAYRGSRMDVNLDVLLQRILEGKTNAPIKRLSKAKR